MKVEIVAPAVSVKHVPDKTLWKMPATGQYIAMECSKEFVTIKENFQEEK